LGRGDEISTVVVVSLPISITFARTHNCLAHRRVQYHRARRPPTATARQIPRPPRLRGRRRRPVCVGRCRQPRRGKMSGHDSKYFSTTKKGEIPELKEELNSQYKVTLPSPRRLPPVPISLCKLAVPADWSAWIQIWPGLLGAHAPAVRDLRLFVGIRFR
jgi:hypothetical protein